MRGHRRLAPLFLISQTSYSEHSIPKQPRKKEIDAAAYKNNDEFILIFKRS